MKSKLQFTFLFFIIVLFAAYCNKNGSDKKIIHQVYKEYNRAILNNDIEMLSKLLSSINQKQLLGNHTESILKMIREMLPEDISITNTTISGNSANLDTEGVRNKKKVTGTVLFIKEDGNWKILKENWNISLVSDIASEPISVVIQPFLKNTKIPPEKYRVLKGHNGNVSSLDFTRNGQYLISASYDDYSIRAWNISSGEMISQVKTKKRITDICIMPTGDKLLIADTSGNIGARAIVSGEIGPSIVILNKAGDKIAISSNGKYLAATSYQKPIVIWDLKKHKLIRTLNTNTDQRTLSFSPDGKNLASGCGKGYDYHIWELP